ncbi:MAG TPA: hypothetical protein VI583_01755 [Cyclobacteriaceae bacterium]|nr:hypothetical protein [Cyclobacteriaceae bacterium]
MSKYARIEPFAGLHSRLSAFINDPDDIILADAARENPWFVREFAITAIKGILNFIDPSNLETWLSGYNFHGKQDNNIGIIMAGNIPLAGFHDLLCVLVSGNKAVLKTSHQDRVLTDFVINCLLDSDPAFRERISETEDLQRVDALIATGSDNSARQFKYLFKDIPRIIRSNRTSCCILDGSETTGDYSKLALDMFLYFGLGCRNVSKIYIPIGYDIQKLISSVGGFEWIIDNGKYYNNYIHHRSLFEMNHEKFIDAGYFILLETAKTGSPVSVFYYQNYESAEDLKEIISRSGDMIQCIVSGEKFRQLGVDFGMAQFPMPWEYADDVDTLKFLLSL